MGKVFRIGCTGGFLFVGLLLVIGIIGNLTAGNRSAGTGQPASSPPPQAQGVLSSTPPASPIPPTQAPTVPSPTIATRPTATPAQGTIQNPFPRDYEVTVGNVKWKVLQAHAASSVPALFGASKQAHGKYVVVATQVENLGKEMKSVRSVDLIDSKGRKFTSASDSFKIEPKQIMILENINPNVPLQFSSVFETPADAEGLVVQVSDLGFLAPKLAYITVGEVNQR